MKETELNPCRFCGGDAEIFEDVEGDCEYPIWRIACRKCPAEMRGDRNEFNEAAKKCLGEIYMKLGPDEKNLIIEYWNKRA